MSRFIVGKCEFDKLDDLTATMESLFGAGSVEQSDDGTNKLSAYGYQGDNRDGEIGKVAAVVRRQHITDSSNDLPIIQGADGKYRIAVSEYDVSAIPQRLRWKGIKSATDIENRFKQLFSQRQMTKGLAKLGFKLTEEVDEEGAIHIHAKKYVVT